MVQRGGLPSYQHDTITKSYLGMQTYSDFGQAIDF